MSDFISHISRSLGRSTPPATVPPPPAIDDKIARLVTLQENLTSRFTAAATAAKLYVERAETGSDGVCGAAIAMLRKARAKKVVVTDSGIVRQSGLADVLGQNGFDVLVWQDGSLDAAYDVDAGITDVYAAVAETGSLAVRRSFCHGLAASLVPNLHIAIVRQQQIMPDLIDLLSMLRIDTTGGGVCLITGPSKTADIEMSLVTGVHGPAVVKVLVV